MKYGTYKAASAALFLCILLVFGLEKSSQKREDTNDAV